MTGTIKRQLTTDGLTEGYTSPSETDAGVIVVPGTRARFFYFRLDGRPLGGPWVARDMNCSPDIYSAVENEVRPDGASNVYWFLNTCGGSVVAEVAFASYGRSTRASTYPWFSGVSPRWVPGSRYAAAVAWDGTQISVMNTAGGDKGSPNGTPWITDDQGRLRYFDISRAGSNVLIALASNPKDIHSRSDLVLWHNHGTAPVGGGPLADNPATVCELGNWGDNTRWPDLSMPRWSPDGTEFTWSDNRGVWVSPAPVAGAGGQCVVHPKLIAAGGNSPSWGLVSLHQLPAPPAQGVARRPAVQAAGDCTGGPGPDSPAGGARVGD